MVAIGVPLHIDGFEVGGLELAQSTVGSPTILGSIASPAGRSGAFALRLNPAATQEQYDTWADWGGGGTSTDGASFQHRLYGFAVRFSDLAPGTEYAFASFFDGADTPLVVATLILEVDGDLRFENQAGSTVLTEGSPFTADVWHYLEISLQGNATGDYELWLDGVSLGSGTSDFVSSSTFLGFARFGGAGSGDGNVDIDDFYLVGHSSTLQGNNLGPSEVFAYQVGPNAATADSGLTTNDSTLNAGAWLAAAFTPLNANLAAYTASPSDGARIFDEDNQVSGHESGPVDNSGDGSHAGYDVTGTIQGAMWLGVYQRGTGGGSSHVQWYGEGSQSPINSYTMDTIGNSTDTWRAVVSENAGPVPTASQSFAMGAGTTGAQDIEISGQWAFLLHTPAAGGSFFETVLGNMPASSGIINRGKELLGNLPAQAGVFTRTLLTAFRTFVGNLPNQTGVVTRATSKFAVGNMPFSTGVILRGKTLLGNMPNQVGVIVRKTTKTILGNLPNQVGVVIRGFTELIEGNMPNSVGVIIRKTTKLILGDLPNQVGILTAQLVAHLTVLGNMPTSTGVVSVLHGIKLLGNMPAQAGVIIRATAKTIIGNMPSATGVVSRGIIILGNLPQQTGTVFIGFFELILGNMPQQTGALFKGFFETILGNVPQQTGAIARKTAKILVGVMPFSTGVVLRGINIVGNMPAFAGAFTRGKLTAFRTILGNMPQQTGVLIGLAASAGGNYLMKLRRKRTGN